MCCYLTVTTHSTSCGQERPCVGPVRHRQMACPWGRGSPLPGQEDSDSVREPLASIPSPQSWLGLQDFSCNPPLPFSTRDWLYPLFTPCGMGQHPHGIPLCPRSPSGRNTLPIQSFGTSQMLRAHKADPQLLRGPVTWNLTLWPVAIASPSGNSRPVLVCWPVRPLCALYPGGINWVETQSDVCKVGAMTCVSLVGC